MSNYPNNDVQGKLTFSADGKKVYGDVKLVTQFQRHISRLRTMSAHVQHAERKRSIVEERSDPT